MDYPAFFIRQINLQKSKVAAVELGRKEGDQLLLITEPYTVFNKVSLLNTTLGRSWATRTAKPRAAIWANNNLQPWLVEEFTDEDICTIAISLRGRTTYVASAYFDINLTARMPKFMSLLEFCRTGGIPLLVGADSNSHSVLWGCEDTNNRGIELEDVIIEHQLIVHNIGSEPTFCTTRAKSIIDITLTNVPAADLLEVTGWRVLEEDSLSDHKYISYQVGRYVPVEKEGRALKKADWGLFQRELEESLNEFTLTGDLDGDVDRFYEHLYVQLDKVAPRRKITSKRKSGWWTPALEAKREELLHFRQKNLMNDPGIARKVNGIRREYRSLIRKEKRKSWREFCSQATSAKDISSLVQIVGADTVKGVSLLKRGDRFAATAEESLSFLMATHFPDHLPADSAEEEEVSSSGRRHSDYSNLETEAEMVANATIAAEAGEAEELQQYFQTWRVKAAINSFQPMKAAGPDELKPVVLQHLGEKGIAAITDLFRQSITLAEVPRRWRKMKVVFIPKTGKSDYSVPKAYRPITLSNFLLKAMERVIYWYLSERVVSLPLANQHAYTRRLGTETALTVFADLVESAVHRGQKSLVVSLDCSGAFDRIKFNSANEALERVGAPDLIRRWYNEVLKKRRVTADLQGTIKAIIPTMGSPQGGILSPLVWNLVMDSLLSKFPDGGVKAIGYADDVILIINGPDTATMANLMRKSLKKVCEWGNKHGLSFNPDKTTAVVFHRGRRVDYSPTLMMEGKELTYSDNLTYLGVTFNKRLSWTPHIKSRVKKCTYLLHKTKNLVGKEWGLCPQRALWIYEAIVRPKLTYGCLVWGSRVGKTDEARLKRVQRMGIKGATHALRSTPLAGMKVVMGVGGVAPPMSAMEILRWALS